jgi:hypothetical protein
MSKVNRRDNQIERRCCVTKRQHIIECHRLDGIFVRSHDRDTCRSSQKPALVRTSAVDDGRQPQKILQGRTRQRIPNMAHLLFTVKEGKHVGTNPLLENHDEATRTRTGPPKWGEFWEDWSTCGMRLMNRETMSFSDPTLEDCYQLTRHYFRAGVWRKPDSVAFVEARRRFLVNPHRTPWAPKPEYVALLERQRRLQLPDHMGASTTGARPAMAMDARNLLNDALGAGEAPRDVK